MSNNYVPADMVIHNYGLSPEAWEKLQKVYADHLAEHKTCEICCARPSIRITPLGTIKAACMECIQIQRQEMIDEYNRAIKGEDW